MVTLKRAVGLFVAPLLFAANPVPDFFDILKPASGVKASLVESNGRRALKVTGPAGQNEIRVALEPRNKNWDLSFFTDIAAKFQNTGASPATISFRIENAGADATHKAITGTVQAEAGKQAVMQMALTRSIGHLDDGSQFILIGMRSFPWATSRKPAQPKIDPSKVVRITLIATAAKGPIQFDLTSIEPTGTTVFKPAAGKPAFPMFDEFGQYIHWEWPGKIHMVEDLRQHAKDEAADLAKHPRPADWDEYGGWASGPTLKATGAFRTEKYQGKWWMVDPNGKLFFSYGPSCVQLNGDPTTLDRRREYFAWLPDPKDPHYKDAYSTAEVREDFDFGTGTLNTFSFLQANLYRKYGDNWREESAELAHRRIASWAMNSIANWSDMEVCRLDRLHPNRTGRTPYSLPVSFRGGAPSLKGRPGTMFHDPYHPAFAQALREGMKEVAELTANDPWCIGYFVQNEVPWNGQNIFLGALESPADQPAKQALIKLLQKKYASVSKLNSTWNTKLASWQALSTGRNFSRAALPAADIDEFYLAFMEQYFKTVRGVVKEIAPDRLYLGCRFHSWSRMKVPAIAAAKYADIVSVNLYATPQELAAFTYPNNLDVPIVLSEWHFGARDRGQLDCGMRAVANQNERAAAYKEFMRIALANPRVVGAHWYRYHDHPSAGRAGGDSRSNSQNGLIDGADTPYWETIEAAREIGHNMYRMRLDQK